MLEKKRVVLIGIDAATFDVMNPLLRKNSLPALRTLMDHGVHGVLRSTIPPITPPAWTSIFTGRNPGKHGIFDFVTRKTGTYEEKLLSSSDRKCEATWNTLSRHGRRVIIVNVPMTYPPEKVLGCMISGIGSPGVSSKIVYPNQLLDEIQRSCGPYRVMYDYEPTDSNCAQFLSDLKDLIQLRGKVVRYLMERFDWDFLAVVFQSTDWIQHFFWRYMDESHPSFVTTASDCQRFGIAEVYEAIDKEIGQIVAKTRARDYLFVVSDHGMGPLYKNIYFNNWLEREGYLKYKRNMRYLAHKAGITSENAYKLATRLAGGKAVARLRSRKETLSRFFLSTKDIDWSRTRAYSIGLDGSIRLNLQGREPTGIVTPGIECSRLISELRSKLRSLSDPETGEKVADYVFSRDEVFEGPWLHEAPDLVLVLTRYHQDYKFGSNAILRSAPDKISGNHRIEGILIASGPDIKKGAEVPPQSVLDITPTVLQILDVPLPDGLDGKPMGSILTSSYAVAE